MKTRKKHRKRSDASIEAQFTELRGNYTPFPRIMLLLFDDHNQAVVWFYLYARDCLPTHTINTICKKTGLSERTVSSTLNALLRHGLCIKEELPRKEGAPDYYSAQNNWRARTVFSENLYEVAKGAPYRGFHSCDRRQYQIVIQIPRKIDKKGIKCIEIPIPNGPMLDTLLTAKDRAFWLWLYIHCQTTPPQNHTLQAIHKSLPPFLGKDLTVSALSSRLNKLRKAGLLEISTQRRKGDVRRGTLCQYKAISIPCKEIPDGRLKRIEAMQNQDEILQMTKMKKCAVYEKSMPVTIGLGFAFDLSLQATARRMNSSPAAAGLRPDRHGRAPEPGESGDTSPLPEWSPYQKDGELLSLRDLNREIQRWQRSANADVTKAVALYRNEENLAPGVIIVWLLKHTRWARLLFDSTMVDYEDYMDDLGAFVLNHSVRSQHQVPFVDWIVQKFNACKRPFSVIREINSSDKNHSPGFWHSQRSIMWRSKMTDYICHILSLSPELLSEFSQWPRPEPGRGIPSYTKEGLQTYLADRRELLQQHIDSVKNDPLNEQGIVNYYGFDSSNIYWYVLGCLFGRVKVPDRQARKFHQSHNWKDLFEHPDLLNYFESKATAPDYPFLFGMKKHQMKKLKDAYVQNLVEELRQLRTYGLQLMEYTETC